MKKTAVEKAQHDLDQARRELAEAIADVKGHVQKMSQLSSWVREYPVSTLAVTFAAGLLAGKYLTYRILVNGLTKTSEIVFGSVLKSFIKDKGAQASHPSPKAAG